MERMKHTGDYELDEINMLEQECSDLEEENKRLEEENKKLREEVKDLVERNIELDKKYMLVLTENKKLKDEFMLKLAEAFLLPPTSNQMAEYKKWNYSKWYDEIKNQMRKEIKEGM